MILFEENRLLERKIEIIVKKLLSFHHEDKHKQHRAKLTSSKDKDHSLEEDKKHEEKKSEDKKGSSSVHS